VPCQTTFGVSLIGTSGMARSARMVRCYGLPAGAIFAGSRAGSRGSLVNVLGGYVNMYWRSLNSSFGFHHKYSSSRKFRVSALIVLEFTSRCLSCHVLTAPFADCTHACPRRNQSSGPVVRPPLWCRRSNSRTHRLCCQQNADSCYGRPSGRRYSLHAITLGGVCLCFRSLFVVLSARPRWSA
jgi:hypothetical protein